MYKVAGLVGILTIISKVLGLGRDLVIANYFGTTTLADAFNFAYLFTGNFFILFGGLGGPFYSSVVAILPKLKSKDPKLIKEFIISILWKSVLGLGVIAIAIFYAKSFFVKLFIDNDAKPELFSLTLTNINILLPLILICGPIGIIFGILNVYKKYVAPSLSPAVVNIVLIGSIFLMGDSYNGLALALGTSIGAILSLLFQVPSALQVFKEIAKKHSDKGLDLLKLNHKYKDILYPAILSTFLGQGMVYVDSYFCGCLPEGSWTSIVMANRLIQLPLGVLLTAFLVPVFPKLSELAHEKDLDGMKSHVKKAIRALVLLCLPATLVGYFFAEPIIKILFERGAFDANSTMLVSTVFTYLALSIIPYVYRDTVTRVFYSLGDSKTPLAIGFLAIFLKIFLNSKLIAAYGIAGVPIATVIIISLNFVILSLILKKKTGSYICFCI